MELAPRTGQDEKEEMEREEREEEQEAKKELKQADKVSFQKIEKSTIVISPWLTWTSGCF